MRLTELSRPNTISDATTILRDAGYELLDIGSFADVFYKKDQPYVLKLFQSNDQAYVKYLELIKSEKNIHFPKIYGKLIKVTNGYYAVRIEKLQKYNLGSEPQYAITLAIASKLIKPIEHFEDSEHQRRLYAAIDYMDKNPELKHACELIRERILIPNNHRFAMDITIHNLMMRGDTIIITDPLKIR